MRTPNIRSFPLLETSESEGNTEHLVATALNHKLMDTFVAGLLRNDTPRSPPWISTSDTWQIQAREAMKRVFATRISHGPCGVVTLKAWVILKHQIYIHQLIFLSFSTLIIYNTSSYSQTPNIYPSSPSRKEK